MLQNLDISQRHPFLQLLLLLAFITAGMIFSSLIAILLGGVIWGQDVVVASASLSPDMPGDAINFLKFSQVVVQVGTMLIAPLLFVLFYRESMKRMLCVNKIGSIYIFLIAVAIPFIILPLVGLLSEWNLAVEFSESLAKLEAYLRQQEDTAAAATEVMLKTDTIGGLCLNIFVIAIVPAISEEILFRGVIQNILKQWFRNIHWAVIVAGFIFSAIHGQFYGFLPRFALGIMLGYLFVYSRSIWVPVIAHFVNNATVAVVSFFESKGMTDTTAEEFGQMDNMFVWGIISLVLTAAAIYMVYKIQNEKRLKSAEH